MGDYAPYAVVKAAAELAEYFPHPEEQRVIGEAFRALLKHLPDMYWEETHPEEPWRGATIPLAEAVTNIGKAIMDFGLPFFSAGKSGYFEGLRKQIEENECTMNGLTPYQRRRARIPDPDERDEPPEERAYYYFRKTPLEDVFFAEVPFRIPRDRWPTHALVLGPSEWGKSELAGLFLKEALEDPEPRAIILCDPHGDLYQKAITRVPPERLVAIDLTINPPDLNILDHGATAERDALQTFRFLLSSLAGGLTPKQEGCIRPLFSLLKEIDGATLITLHEIIAEQTRKPKQFAEQISRLNPIHRSFFESLWYGGEYSDTRQALQWKVTATIDDPTFYRMFSAKRNSITVSKWIEERKVVLIKSSDQLDKEGTQLFFLYLLGQYYTAAKRRDALPQSKRHLAQLFFDEASVVLQSPLIADILTEIRKYNCSFVALSQLWEHVAKEVRPAILGSCGIRILGQLGHDEASALYRDQRVPLETITGLKAVPRAYAQWCFYVRAVTEKGVVVRTPYGALERMPRLQQSMSSMPTTPKTRHTQMHESPALVKMPAIREDDMAEIIEEAWANKEKDEAEYFSQEPPTDEDHILPACE